MPGVKSRYDGTFVDEQEAIVDDVAEWGAQYVEDVVEVLMPDGRAFGQRKRSPQEQRQAYLETRNSIPAWEAWIASNVEQVTELLRGSGFSDQMIATASPYAIVFAAAIEYSARMERALHRASERVSAMSPRPVLLTEYEEEDDYDGPS